MSDHPILKTEKGPRLTGYEAPSAPSSASTSGRLRRRPTEREPGVPGQRTARTAEASSANRHVVAVLLALATCSTALAQFDPPEPGMFWEPAAQLEGV